MKTNYKQQINKKIANQKEEERGLVSIQKISNNGITLIALVITIIVLLILASVAINLTLGDNGIFTKAKEAAIKQDIEETRELIKLEIMGNFDEKSANYTNQDVINAVEKITGVTVDKNAPTVESKKGNKVDITDLWIPIIYIRQLWNPSTGYEVEVPYSKGQIWTWEYIHSLPEETEVKEMRAVRDDDKEGRIYFNADNYDYPFLLLDGRVVKYGDPLVNGGHYSAGYPDE